MNIKQIQLPDYQLVTGLFNKYRMFYKQPSDTVLAERFIKDRLQNNESRIFVALADKDGEEIPAGVTQLYPVLSSVSATRNWLLNDLFVEDSYRRQGVGEALIKAAIDFARADQSTYIKLETAVDNYTAQRLYEALGFKKGELNNGFHTYKFNLVKE
ncbi:GNAT family N-acetyltransferase [soil metagenome]